MSRKSIKQSVLIIFAACILSFSAFASEGAASAFVEGCKAYSKGDWTSAEFLLRKAVGYQENQTPETYYMLISSEVYAGDYRSALDDCNVYLDDYNGSLYYSRVHYYKGQLLYKLGEYEQSIIVLSDFCHQYEKDDMYSFALFYIGESLFAGYKYDEAEAIYQRIVVDFPESEKAPAAQYRIESILQRDREEKLLYLLKQTGEEYLSAKEEYEKQLRMYNADSVNTTKQKLAESQKYNQELEERVKDLERQLEQLRIEYSNVLEEMENRSKQIPAELNNPKLISTDDIPQAEPYDESVSDLYELKKKALEVQQLLNNKKE